MSNGFDDARMAVPETASAPSLMPVLNRPSLNAPTYRRSLFRR